MNYHAVWHTPCVCACYLCMFAWAIFAVLWEIKESQLLFDQTARPHTCPRYQPAVRRWRQRLNWASCGRDTDNSQWSRVQITTGSQTHTCGKAELANLSRGGTHGNVKTQLRKPEGITLFYYYSYYFFGQWVSRLNLKTTCVLLGFGKCTNVLRHFFCISVRWVVLCILVEVAYHKNK